MVIMQCIIFGFPLSWLQDQNYGILTDNQAARAGLYSYMAMRMKEDIENETLKPVKAPHILFFMFN